MTRTLQLASVAILIAGLLAGCGGSSSADPLTRSDYINEANSICRDAEAERSEVLREAADGGDPGLSGLTMDALEPVQSMVDELSGLSPPAGDAKEANAIVDAFAAAVAEVRANAADATAAISAFAEANQLAADYGLTDCTI